ncbi:MAG: NUDIX domain-containing protein [Marinilabiliaceae bacterium]|nr:NUDIX domain-containing protein [Marinilabiliaceae bacterium]
MNNRIILLKQLLPGLLPLIFFIVADELWGTKVGLIVAIAFGIIEIGFGYLKGQKPDKFILLDLGLIVVMGLISIVLENDFFFKLKPVIIGFIMSVMLGIAVFIPGNIMLDMSRIYMKNIEINPWQQWEFKQSLKLFFYLLLVHTVVTLGVSLWGTTREWGLISGPGFFIVFGVFMLVEVYRKKIQYKRFKNEEWLPLVDEDGKVVGSAPRSVVHKGSKLLHPVVHLHVINERQIYLQKRPMNKLVQPGKWDTAVGGHIAAGESVELALKREAKEEIGLANFKASLLNQYIWMSDIENELVFMFIADYSGKLTPHSDEVEEGRFWTLTEIEQKLGKNFFTSNFEKEFKILKEKKIITTE